MYAAYAAKHVANSILVTHWNRDKYPSISPMKLQKLMYFVHGWHLAVHARPAVNEGFHVWPYGPVNEDTYHAFKRYRQRSILQLATELDSDGNEVPYIVGDQESKFYEILNMVMDKYGHLSALQLSAMTHSQGSPWHQARVAGQRRLDDDLIQRHYIGLAKSEDMAS